MTLRTRLLLKRIELCFTKNRFKFQINNKIEEQNSTKSYLSHQKYSEIDEKMMNLFYRKVLMMRISGKNSSVDRYRNEKVGILFSKFLEKYKNPIREEINEDMVEKFVEENQREIFSLR